MAAVHFEHEANDRSATAADWWRRLLDYDAWANRQYAVTLAGFVDERPGHDVPLRAMAIFAHLLASHRLWQSRLLGDASAPPMWPSPHPTRFVEEVDALRAGWDAVLACVEPGQVVRYTSAAGRASEATAEDLLTHLVLHAGFHRGQIAMLLGRCNVSPPATDFLLATRLGAVAEPALS